MSFEDRLIHTLDSLDESEAERLLNGIELHGKVSSSSVIKRISRTERTHIRPIRSTVMLAVIIAVLLIATVTGAATYVLSAHKESVDKRFGSGAGDIFESGELLDGTVFDSEHYRITVDTVLCTGDQVMAVITLEPKDEETKARIQKQPILGISGKGYGTLSSALEQQGCSVTGAGYGGGADSDDKPTKLIFFLNISGTFPENRIYKTPVTICEKALLAKGGEDAFTAHSDDEIEAHALGTVTLNITKNIDYREFRSFDGTKLGLCDIGFSCDAYHELHAFEDVLSLTFEYSDGAVRELSGTDISNYSCSANSGFGSYTLAGFSKLTDTSKVTAVIIEGVRYEEVRE